MPLAATSLRIPASLKSRIEKLAVRSGSSAHALMVRALTEHVATAERHQAFLDEGAREDLAMRKSETGFAMQDVHAYITAKAQGKAARRPARIRWQK